MMNDMVERELANFVVDRFLFGDVANAPARDAALITTRLIDSMGVLELVTFLEERFGIAVADTDIVPDNLDSLTRMAAYVSRKRSAR
jgi:acyl carrier protein